MTVRPHVSIVVPAYREQAVLPASIEAIRTYFETTSVPFEILVVDDGSPDDTSRVAERALAGGGGRVLRLPENRGKGAAVRTGVLAAHGRWVLITDADLSTPIEEHARLSAVCRERDLDGAIGSRGLAESNVEVRQGPLRQFMGKTFNGLVRILTGLPYADTQCGFKWLDRERFLPLFEQMVVDRFAWDVELLFLARRLGLSVVEVPVTWRNDEDSKVGLIGDPINMLFDVARVRLRFRRGEYRGK
jgi:glycosyltransferase involved in cell wall biosynthesis